MEGLHNRKKETQNQEDEAEFLDEEEQEKLLEQLREQNNTANLNIQRGLIIVGCITSSLFFSMLIQSGAPIIPISHILSVPVLSSLGSPTTAAISSILSIGTSIAALVIKCRVNIFGLLHDWNLNDRYTKRTVFGAVLTGAFAPLMCLMYSSSLIEFIFWIIPLVVLGMYYTALSMMNQVQDSLEELEKSKYKYKGA